MGKRVALLVLHHPEDLRTRQGAARYRETLVDPGLLVVSDLRDFLASMAKAATEVSQRTLVKALSLRYLDHENSEDAWRRVRLASKGPMGSRC